MYGKGKGRVVNLPSVVNVVIVVIVVIVGIRVVLPCISRTFGATNFKPRGKSGVKRIES